MQNKKETITKLDAALRQLETAIELWFNSGDSLSVHTLACAAYQILYDINKHQNGPSMTPDTDLIKPEKRKLWLHAIKAHSNFFKHADSDPNGTIVFNADVTEHYIFEAILFYSIITKETCPFLVCFQMWMIIHESVWFKREVIDRLKETLPIDDMKVINKREFFYGSLPMITKTIGVTHRILQ